MAFDEWGNPEPIEPALEGPGGWPLPEWWFGEFDGQPVTWPGQQPSAKQEMEVGG